MGIQYRFDMTVDPEPHDVKRLAPTGVGLHWEVWHRLPCRRNRDMPPRRRGEFGARLGERRFKRGAKFKHRIARRSRKCMVSTYGTHFHWDTKPRDKCRAWGSFRGTTKVINVDAFSRMRSQYRAKKRKW